MAASYNQLGVFRGFGAPGRAANGQVERRVRNRQESGRARCRYRSRHRNHVPARHQVRLNLGYAGLEQVSRPIPARWNCESTIARLCRTRQPTVRLILTLKLVAQHTEQMINALRRMKVSQRWSLVIVTVAGLGFIGHFIWRYASWPFSLLIVVAIILNAAGNVRDRPTRHPQENDPNRR